MNLQKREELRFVVFVVNREKDINALGTKNKIKASSQYNSPKYVMISVNFGLSRSFDILSSQLIGQPELQIKNYLTRN